jgi:hypothetical protein
LVFLLESFEFLIALCHGVPLKLDRLRDKPMDCVMLFRGDSRETWRAHYFSWRASTIVNFATSQYRHASLLPL